MLTKDKLPNSDNQEIAHFNLQIINNELTLKVSFYEMRFFSVCKKNQQQC